MISNEIETVSKTNILVAPNDDNTRQLVVYSNYVNNLSETNAMVLPVPLPQTIDFIDLSQYSDLFEDCSKCFYNPARTMYRSLNTNSYNTRDDKPLKVFNVGSYKVSLAMNLKQLSNVDPKIFTLSSGLQKTLEMYYYQPYWGFIICKLNSGSELYHPFAYSHQIIDSKIYIPTRHYHQEVNWINSNNWNLGSHLDPKNNPIITKTWTDDNIDMSPMFRTEAFNKTTPETHGWINFVGGLMDDINNYFSVNNFNTPDGQFNNSPNQSISPNHSNSPNQSNSSFFETNSIAKMSVKYNNLLEHNTLIDKTKTEQISSNQNQNYKNIADDWSHSIYLLNVNGQINNNIKQMNSCKEIWYNKTIFDFKKIRFNFGNINEFSKLKIEGTHPNIDLVIPIVA